jgi:hypothetical protein
MSFEKAFINQFLRIILSPRYWEFSCIYYIKEKIFLSIKLYSIDSTFYSHSIHIFRTNIWGQTYSGQLFFLLLLFDIN